MKTKHLELARECVLAHHMPWQRFSMLPPYSIWYEETGKIQIGLVNEFFTMTTEERKTEVLQAMKEQLEEKFKTAIVAVEPGEYGYRITVTL